MSAPTSQRFYVEDLREGLLRFSVIDGRGRSLDGSPLRHAGPYRERWEAGVACEKANRAVAGYGDFGRPS
jgi:hypothetical protein